MQSSKKDLKSIVSQSKPFNRLIEFGFTPEVLQFVQDKKDKVIGTLQVNLQQKEQRLEDVEKYYKNGVYTKDRYIKEKKKAKEAIVVAKKKIKNLSTWQSDEVLAHSSNVLNPATENAMTSKFSGTSYIESKAKKLLPYFNDNYSNVKDNQGYENAWREILKSESHEFPKELSNIIKLVEARRQAILDLLDYFKVGNVSSLKKNKNTILYRMLENIDNDLKELNKRVKDPKYDFEIRVRDATTNVANKVVLGEYAKKRKTYKEIKESLKKGEEALNLLKISKPVDESRLFTPSVGLLFSAHKSNTPMNPLQLTPTRDDKRDPRKSLHL